MQISLASNYDIDIVAELASYSVKDVYGKLSSDLVGGGRASYSSLPVTLSHLEDYISELKKYDMHFTYLLNSACLSNREWDRRWQKKLFKLIEKLISIGVTRLTVSTPMLFKIIKTSFPQLYIKVGIFAQIDTPLRARYWQDMGADEMTLESFSINRDFKRLRKIREAVTCKLQLIVNHPCLPNCPLQYYHQNGLSHASDGSNKIFIDYCFLTCSYQRLKDPSLMIKSQWIRPEDLRHYEEIGIDTFKLLERNIPSAQLLSRAKAYHQRKSPANLADLIMPYGFPQKQIKKWRWLMKNFFKPFQVKPSKLIPVYKLIKQQGIILPQDQRYIFIDSKAIPDDFLEKFKTTDCMLTDCKACSYCQNLTEKVIKIDPDSKQQSMANYEHFDNLVTTGKFWDVK